MTKARFKLKKKAAGSISTPPPTITTAANQAFFENAAISIALTADQTVSWSIIGGADQLLYSIVGTDLLMTAKNYEVPVDANTDNNYVVIVEAFNSTTGLSASKTITTAIQDVVEGAPATDIRKTQNVLIDWFPEISGLAAGDAVSITMTGPGELLMQPSPGPGYTGWNVSAGHSVTYTKREIMNGMILATSNANEGSAISIEATWSGGSLTKNFTVTDFPLSMTRNIGPRTLCGYGNFIISRYLPGTPSLWSIKSQKQGTTPVALFAIWPHNFCLTWADNTGGTSATKYGTSGKNGTVVLGDAAYTVVLQNPSEGYADRTITFNCRTNILSAGPNPGVGTGYDYNGGKQHQVADYIVGDWCFGDVIEPDDGQYNPSGFTTNVVTGTTYSHRTVDPNTNVQPLNATVGPWGTSNWTWDGRTFNDGWLTVRPLHPQSVDLGIIKLDGRGINTAGGATPGYLGVHFSWLKNIQNIQQPGGLQDGTGYWDWLIVSNSIGAGLTLSNNDRPSRIFFLRISTSDVLFACGQEGQAIGNLAHDCPADIFNTYFYDVTDTGRSQFAWNVCINGNCQNWWTTHPDAAQAAATAAWVRLNAINGTTYPMRMLGCDFLKGDSHIDQITPGGYDLPTFQGFNCGAMYQTANANTRALWRLFGNTVCNDFIMGIAINNAAVGSYVKQCEVLSLPYNHNVDPARNVNGELNGGDIWIAETTITPSGGSGSVTIDHCVVHNANGYRLNQGSPPTPTLDKNKFGLVYADAYTAPAAVPANWQGPALWEANLTPKAGGPLTVGGTGAPAGLDRSLGTHGVNSIINKRAWTWDTTLSPGMAA